MRLIYFTKFDPQLDAAALGEKAQRLGVDGLDLAVRAGHAINPENVGGALPAARKVWEKQGVWCPLVTGGTDLVDPKSGEAERLFAACGEAGVGLVKIGYWRYQAGEDYWGQVDRIRGALEGFARLGERAGVKACYHTHSGGYYGSNCAGMMHLLRGLDPARVGAYLDTGHLAVEGEDFGQGLAMVGSFLSAVAAKDLRKRAEPGGDPPRWRGEHVKLGAGFFNWREGLAALREVGFAGPLSVHGEYSQADAATRDRWVTEDVQFLKRLLGGTG